MSTVSDIETKQRIAANLCRLRGDRSLAEIARRAGSYATTIKEIEDGVRMPGVGLLTRIADVFNVGIDEFLKASKTSKKSA